MTIDLTAFDFLPDNLQEDNELYPWLAPLIDHALPPPGEIDFFQIEDLITRLGVKYESPEAVNAYFNKFIKPILGTRPAMQFAFDLIGTSARIIEWFESETPVPAFKFIIEFDTYLGTFDFSPLLDLIYTLKNERSWPTAIRMAECADNLILDYGALDREPMSASEGYMNESGIVICLFQYANAEIFPDRQVMHQLASGLYSQWYEFALGLRLDYSSYDDAFEESWAAIIGQQGTITTEQVSYFLEDEVCTAPYATDLSVLGYCRSSTIMRQAYHTGTYESQMVLSDYGTLSGGEGFVGAWIDTEPTFYLDDPDSLLSQVKAQVVPLLYFEWILHCEQNIDQTDMYASVVRSLQRSVATSVYGTWLDFTRAPDPFLLDDPDNWGFYLSSFRTTIFGGRAIHDLGIPVDIFARQPAYEQVEEATTDSDTLSSPEDTLFLSGGFGQSKTGLDQTGDTYALDFPRATLIPYGAMHSGLYDAVMELSGEGTLSDGRGCSLEVVARGSFDQTLDQFLLSDNTLDEFPVLELAWISHEPQLLDPLYDFVIHAVIAQALTSSWFESEILLIDHDQVYTGLVVQSLLAGEAGGTWDAVPGSWENPLGSGPLTDWNAIRQEPVVVAAHYTVDDT